MAGRWPTLAATTLVNLVGGSVLTAKYLPGKMQPTGQRCCVRPRKRRVSGCRIKLLGTTPSKVTLLNMSTFNGKSTAWERRWARQPMRLPRNRQTPEKNLLLLPWCLHCPQRVGRRSIRKKRALFFLIASKYRSTNWQTQKMSLQS